MRRVLLFALSITLIKSSSAQLTKHNWLVGGTGYFSSTTNNIETAQGQKITNLQLSPNIGYFITDKFAPGLKLSFGSTRYKMKNQNSLGKYTTYSFGPFL